MFYKKKDAPAPAAVEPLPLVPAMQTRTAASAPVPAPPPRPKPASMIAHGLTIRGDVSGDGELHLDCVVIGDIKVGKLVLGPNGRVEGSIAAQAVEVHGKVVGAMAARAVRLYGTAKIEGDIAHEQLAMETGAEFQGRSIKFNRPAAPPVEQVAQVAKQPAPPPASVPYVSAAG